MSSNNRQQGQALLLVVLIMVVSLTIGLSVATRSITNVRNSTEEADSQKAFSAAEAGVEQALKGATPNPTGFFSGTEKIPLVNIITQGGTGVSSLLLEGGKPITKDEGVDVWLANHYSDGNIDYTSIKDWNLSVDWWDKTITPNCDSSSAFYAAAMEIIVLYGTSASDVKIAKYTADPACSDRKSLNHFSDGSIPGNHVYENGSKTLKYSTDTTGSPPTTISITNGIVARIIPLYNDSIIGVRCTGDGCYIPEQGNLISSTGQSGQAQRKIQVFQQKYPSLPAEFFRYALLAP